MLYFPSKQYIFQLFMQWIVIREEGSTEANALVMKHSKQPIDKQTWKWPPTQLQSYNKQILWEMVREN